MDKSFNLKPSYQLEIAVDGSFILHNGVKYNREVNGDLLSVIKRLEILENTLINIKKI